jgi:hypothetical protein
MASDIVAAIAKILHGNAILEEPTVKGVWMRTLEIEVSNTILTSEEQSGLSVYPATEYAITYSFF